MSLFTRRPRPEDPEDLEGNLDPLPPTTPAPAATPRPIELRDWEIPVGYAVAGFVVLLAILELTVTSGKGAPKNPNPVLPSIALVVGLAQAATIRYKNRLLTAILGVVGGLLIAYVPVPYSLGILHSIGFLAPFVYAFLITQRHSRAQRALQGPRNRARAGGRRGAKPPPEPSGPKASRRYTPPRSKEDRPRRR